MTIGQTVGSYRTCQVHPEPWGTSPEFAYVCDVGDGKGQGREDRGGPRIVPAEGLTRASPGVLRAGRCAAQMRALRRARRSVSLTHQVASLQPEAPSQPRETAWTRR